MAMGNASMVAAAINFNGRGHLAGNVSNKGVRIGMKMETQSTRHGMENERKALSSIVHSLGKIRYFKPKVPSNRRSTFIKALIGLAFVDEYNVREELSKEGS
eukprot:scaffold106761_cov29-Prasinocladus_malaysianus.AAC.1